MPPTDPTADYRKYPKGPNFSLIVALAAIALILLLAIGLWVLKGGAARKADPVNAHPEPNSRLLLPGAAPGGRLA